MSAVFTRLGRDEPRTRLKPKKRVPKRASAAVPRSALIRLPVTCTSSYVNPPPCTGSLPSPGRTSRSDRLFTSERERDHDRRTIQRLKGNMKKKQPMRGLVIAGCTVSYHSLGRACTPSWLDPSKISPIR